MDRDFGVPREPGPCSARRPRRTMVMVFILLTVATPALRAQYPEALAANDSPSADMAAGPAESAADIPGIEPEVAVTERGRVNMHVADLPLSTVLQILSVQSKRNIVASSKVSGTVTANLFDVTFEEALSAVLTANDAGFERIGSFIYVRTLEELAAISRRSRFKPVTRVFNLNYISSRDAVAYVTPLLADDDSITASPPSEAGIASGRSGGGGQSHASADFIIVNASTETLREVAGILTQVDIRPRQVLIEATILRAELKDDNALGIDFTLVGGVDLELMNSVSNAITDITVGQLPAARFEHMNSTVTTDFASSVPDGGITIGVIKDQVAMFIRALEQVTDTTVLANPKVLALDKQKGQVIVGRRDGFLTTTVTETQAIQTVEFLETGTQLIFRPFISGDGYIRVELHPEDSVGFVNAQGLPSEQTTEITTNVLIRDGETILIGGLFREVTTDARSQVPFLGSIPFLGPLFRSRNDSTAREEVIILMTVTIIDDQADYARESAEVMEDIERMRVGIRQGLMWHGRDRLAERHYQKALEAMAADDSEKALWHARMSVHNNGRFLPSINLRDSILRKRAWDDDGTAARMFLHDLIARERGYGEQMFGRPPRVTPPSNGQPVSPDEASYPAENGGQDE